MGPVARDAGRPPPRPSPTNCVGEGERRDSDPRERSSTSPRIFWGRWASYASPEGAPATEPASSAPKYGGGWVGEGSGLMGAVARDGGRPPPRPSTTNCVGEGERRDSDPRERSSTSPRVFWGRWASSASPEGAPRRTASTQAAAAESPRPPLPVIPSAAREIRRGARGASPRSRPARAGSAPCCRVRGWSPSPAPSSRRPR